MNTPQQVHDFIRQADSHQLLYAVRTIIPRLSANQDQKKALSDLVSARFSQINVKAVGSQKRRW